MSGPPIGVVVALLAVVLAVLPGGSGCKKSGPDCTSAAANVVKVSGEGLARIPGMKSRLPAMKDLLATRCTADAWPHETIACVRGASLESELEACQRTMTPAQQAAVRQVMMDLIGGGGGGGGGAGGGGPAPGAPARGP